LLGQNKLKELLSNEKEKISKIELVFIAACTSESNGKVFEQLGAKHVICIKHKKLVMDDAIIVFTEQFYSKLFNSGNVCTAYKHAIEFLKQNDKLRGETNIFTLLPNSENHTCKDVTFTNAKGFNRFTNLTPKVSLSQIPVKMQDFYYRAVPITKLINMLLCPKHSGN